MKTHIYVDGYNLYYGCLKRTSHKWLDVVRLLTAETLPTGVAYEQPLVKYFTAEITGNAAQDPHSQQDQKTYHRALEASYLPSELQIILGYFDVKDSEAYLIDRNEPKKPPRECVKAPVWKLEEKQSDVNIAIESVVDALQILDLEQVVFVTNDSDISPALRTIKRLRPDIQIGLIIPVPDSKTRPATEKLTKHADWCLPEIRKSWLKRAQLPRVVVESKRQKLRKPIVKPDGWFGASDVLGQIIETLMPVCDNKRANCWKWLNTPKPEVDGLPIIEGLPSEHLDSLESAEIVLAHARAYRDFKSKDNE